MRVENLPPTCREIYEEKYAKEEVWGLKYNLTSVLRSEEKRPILYYVLGALFGDEYIFSKHKICLAVKDLELVEKFEDRVSAIGLSSKKLGLVVKVKPRDKGRSHVLRI